MTSIPEYVWTEADNAILNRARAGNPGSCARYPQCSTRDGEHVCYVTPYGIRPSPALPPAEPGATRTDIDTANSKEKWRATRFYEGTGEWVALTIPTEVVTLGDLCKFLVATDPVLYPKAWYTDNLSNAARMLFDHWENTHFRWMTVRAAQDGSARFSWLTYSGAPESIPVRAVFETKTESGEIVTETVPLRSVVQCTIKIQETPAAPNQEQTTVWDEVLHSVELFIHELNTWTKFVNDMLKLSNKAIDSRMQTLRALNIVSAIAEATKVDRESTQVMKSTEDADAIIALVGSEQDDEGDGLFPKARSFLLQMPTQDNLYTFDEGVAHNTGEDMQRGADALRVLLHEPNGYVEHVVEWSKRVLETWNRAEGPSADLPDPVTLDTLDRLTNAMAAAHLAHGEGGPTTRSDGTAWDAEELEALGGPVDRATSSEDLDKPTTWDAIRALVGSPSGQALKGVVSMASVSFANLPGPTTLAVAWAHVSSSWKLARLTETYASNTRGVAAFSEEGIKALQEFSDGLLKKIPGRVADFKAVLNGTAEEKNLIQLLHEYGDAIRSGDTNQIATATKTLEDAQWKHITKNMALRQSTILMKSLGALCQIFVTVCGILAPSTSESSFVRRVDFLQTFLAAGGAAATSTVDVVVQMVAKFNVSKVVSGLANAAKYAKWLGRVGNAFGLLGAVLGVVAGAYALLDEDATVRQRVAGGLSALGSLGLGIVAAMGLWSTVGPITTGVAVIAGLVLVASGVISLSEVIGSFANETNQVATSVLVWLRRSPDWQAFEGAHTEDVAKLEAALSGYLPPPPANNEEARGMLARAGLPDEVIDQICTRDANFGDMMPSMG